jgi:hypothetical protein
VPDVEVPARPCPSRVWDALLGGSRNLAADRALAAVLTGLFPALPAAFRDARRFTGRAVTWAARQGIGQFVAAEAGLPIPGAVHEAARAVIPSARVAYICAPGDASALAWARAAVSPGVTAVRTAGLLASPAVQSVISVPEPACVVLPMIVHLLPAAFARDVVAGAAAGLAPGSAVVVSALVPDPGAQGDALVAAFAPAADVYRHPPAVIGGWLAGAGLEVVPPGVTDVRGWRAGMPEPRLRPRLVPAVAAGVVARVPG